MKCSPKILSYTAYRYTFDLKRTGIEVKWVNLPPAMLLASHINTGLGTGCATSNSLMCLGKQQKTAEMLDPLSQIWESHGGIVVCFNPMNKG